MKTLTIEVTDDTASTLVELCQSLTSAGGPDGYNTHGELTPEKLLAMLAEDCALVVTRPGSWEGANMAGVLGSHGYS